MAQATAPILNSTETVIRCSFRMSLVGAKAENMCSRREYFAF